MNEFVLEIHIKYLVKTEKSDILLIQEILAQNEQSFEHLYNRYKRLYMSICLRYFPVRSDAEDSLQEAMIKVYQCLEQYDPSRSSFITWSKKIVINKCLEKLRKPSFVNYVSSIFDFAQRFTTVSGPIENLNLQDLTRLIQSLPVGYRTVFNLYTIDGFSHQEIAEKLNISVSTSKTQLMKAKKLLKRKIKQDIVIFEHNYA